MLFPGAFVLVLICLFVGLMAPEEAEHRPRAKLGYVCSCSVYILLAEIDSNLLERST